MNRKDYAAMMAHSCPACGSEAGTRCVTRGGVLITRAIHAQRLARGTTPAAPMPLRAVRIDTPTWERAQRAAAAQGITVSQLIRDGLRTYGWDD